MKAKSSVEIEVKLREQISQGMAQVDAAVGKSTKSLGQMVSQGKRAFGTVKDIAAGFGFAFGIGASFNQVVGAVKEYYEELKKTELAMSALVAQHQMFGEATQHLAKQVKDLAAANLELHGVAASETTGLVGMVNVLGLLDTAAIKAVESGVLLHKTMGTPLNESVRAVALSMTGATQGFEEMSKILNANVKDADDLAKALAFVEERAKLPGLRKELRDRSWSDVVGWKRGPDGLEPIGKNEGDIANLDRLKAEIERIEGLTSGLTRGTTQAQKEADQAIEAAKKLTESLIIVAESSIPEDAIEEKIAAIRAKVTREIAVLAESVQTAVLSLDRIGGSEAGAASERLAAAAVTAQAGMVAKAQREIDMLVEKLIPPPIEFPVELVLIDKELTTFAQGVESRLKELGASWTDAFAAGQDAVDGVAESLHSNISQGLIDAIEGTKSFQRAFEDMAKGVIQDIIRMTIKMQVMDLIGQGMSLLGGGGNRYWGDGGLPYADGGIQPGNRLPVRSYSMGGVAHRPQLALYGEGRGAEAFVPLPGPNRGIPVEWQGGAPASEPVINNFHFNLSMLDAAQADSWLMARQGTFEAMMTRAMTRSRQIQTTYGRRS